MCGKVRARTHLLISTSGVRIGASREPRMTGRARDSPSLALPEEAVQPAGDVPAKPFSDVLVAPEHRDARPPLRRASDVQGSAMGRPHERPLSATETYPSPALSPPPGPPPPLSPGGSP